MEDISQDQDQVVTDVVVLGAGPGGCSAAILLAQAGLKVVILEKAKFPRFRIGESLLPNGNRMLKRLGILEKMDEAGFIRKYGAEFTISDASQTVHNRFADGLVPGCDYAYEVERAKFDQLLLDQAKSCGCRVLEETAAQSVRELSEGWEIEAPSKVEGRAQSLRSRWIIDASGRESFLAKKFQLQRDPLPYPKRLAVYAHFEGIPLQAGERRGNIVITRLRDGWFWNIPLEENRTSLGVVTTLDRYRAKETTPEAFFETEVSRSSYLSDLTRTARRTGDFHVTTDYCFMYEKFAGPRYVLVGDAAAFMDPIFSSGVYLAMASAGRAADMVIKAEQAGRGLTPAERLHYTATGKKCIRAMRKLIETFYDDRSFAVFLRPTDRFRLAAAVNAVVAGNTELSFRVWWRFRLFLIICQLNRRFGFVPSTLPAERIRQAEPASDL